MKVLIFTSATCIPCRQLKPHMLRLQARHGFEMEVIEASPVTQPLFEQHGVRGVPMVIAVNDQDERMGAFAGAQAEAICENYLRTWGVIE